ncbi:MAG: hypothetical protein KZY55_08755 [Paeniclostridium sp.]|uniref:TRADD-N-associated membrane domain-containing protein n=1 Tax=Paraclostridium sordellii TaxID=1505 RepID=UPI0005DCA8B6|nr:MULTISPECIES: hypothetical protein [Paeniclostridium]MBW4862906.1 hypothetical protein [Paeniclostridium sp.]MBW4874142.1 hypothetical protein [Paeniclostridium sp.]MBX9179720.1 hypothetical protein [Paeniclostridium sordellii]CEN93601.1 Uncharacterised protein [[Clostridium] sordellii] [Paeniclostridium sordellii]CEN95170.1 Uncharacterised protein [[Clostridium] sordellii] [Paeniclostridium sordellii]
MDKISFISILISILGILAGIIAAFITFNEAIKRNRDIESKEIKESLKDIQSVSYKKKEDNIIDLMLMNIKELKEYYVISKIQARNSFIASIFICFVGMFIYILGIIGSAFYNIDVTMISLISGTVVELIAGSFFWLHNKSIKQLNLYHRRLGYTEKYLTAIQIINSMSEDRKDEEYRNLINFILSDNSKVISSEVAIDNSI